MTTAPAGTRCVIDGLDNVDENLYLEFNAPDGSRLFGGFDFFRELQDIPRYDPAFLPQSGTYTLTLRGITASDAGSYSFRVLDMDTFGIPISLNTLVSSSFPTRRETLVYTFNATVGDNLLFDGRSGAFIFGIYNDSLNAVYGRGIFGAASTAEVDGIGRILRTGRHYVLFHGDPSIPQDFSFQIQNLSLAPSLAIGNEAIGSLYALKATARDASGNEGSSTVSMRVFDPADTQGPTIRLTSPQPNSTITKLTDIVGSITDDNLQFYRIDVGRADLVDVNRPEENDPDYRTLVSSNVNAVDKVLATLDPTMLINDDYVIRIIAKDLSDNVSAKTVPLSLDGQLKLGELKLDFTDLSVAVAGIPITITRSYDSRNANKQGDFGYGWSLSVQDAQIRETIPVNPLEEQGLYFAATPFQEGTKVYLTNPEGRRVGFTFKPQRQFSLFGGGSYAPKFVADPGVNDQLDVGSVPLRNINGSFYSSFFGDPFNPSAYRLTTKFGVVYEYGQFDGLANVIDRSGNRLEFRADGIFSSTGLSYDAVGNLTQTIDRNGRTHAYIYDADNRLLREDWIGAGGGVVHSIVSAYDANGNLTSASDSDSSYHYVYDANSRVTTVDNLGTPNLPQVILNYSFDVMGNRLSVSDNFGVKVNSTFDVRNLLSSESWSGPGINPARVNFQYDATRQRTELNRYTDLLATTSAGRTLHSFDAAGRLSRIAHVNSVAGVLTEYGYSYDKASQLVSETVNGLTDQYTYDSSGQLKGANYSARDDEAFSYDAAGNRTTIGIVVGPNNRIQSDSQFAYAYDKEGNLVQKTNSATQAVTKYSYDYRNRLTAVEDFSSTGTSLAQVRYTYDVFDRRIATTSGGTTKYTVNDRDRVWADFSSSGSVVARYLFGPNVDELIARQRPTEEIVWYLPDRLGSVRDLANSAGTVVNHVDYNAFGDVAAEANPTVGDRFKYAGREYDSETGLYNYRARYYMPTLGVFMSEDPLGFCAGDANLRRYVANRPTGATDPSGMQAIADFGGLIASQIEVLTTLLEFGGDDPYSFRVGGKGGQIGAGLSGDFSLTGPLGGGIDGNLNLTDPSKSGPQLNIGDAVFNNGDEGIANKAGAKALSAAAKQGFEPDPKPTPFPAGEFQFFVESTAYKKSYFDHFLARFNVALYGGVAEELNLIAKYAVTDDASTLVQVRDKQGIWEAHAFATRTPTLPNQRENRSPSGNNPPPPDGGFGFKGSGPSPGAGNPDDGDGDDGDGSGGGGGCCGGIYIARSYLSDAYAQVWAEPTTIRAGLQFESDNNCLHFANTHFVYLKMNSQRLNTNH